jgi:hypothetical protein
MSATVTVAAGVWTLEIADESRGWSYSTKPITFTAEQSSAEWIAERPEICGSTCSLAALADFGAITFAVATAAIDSTPPAAIDSYAYSAIEMKDGATVLAVPGPLSSNGEAFSDDWKNS